MKLKLSPKKTLISMILSLILGSILYIIDIYNLLEFEMNLLMIIGIFIISWILIYLIWSLLQSEYGRDTGEDYESIYETVEEKDENENNETNYQQTALS